MTKKILSILFIIVALATAPQRISAKDFIEADNMLIDAIALFNDSHYTEACKILTHIISEYPEYDAAHYYLGVCCCFTGDMEKGEMHLREACRLDPGNFWYQDNLASICASTGHIEIAIEIHERLIKEYPKKTGLYYTLANLYVRQGQYDKVLETFDNIEQTVGNSEMLAISRFQVLMRQEKQEEAYAVLERYNEKYTSPQVLSAMGDFKLSQYEDSLALEFYNEALSYEPSFDQALIGRVEAYRISRKYPEFFKALDGYIAEHEVAQGSKTMYISQLLQHSDPRFRTNFRSELDSTVTRMYNCAPTDSTTISTAAIYWYNTQRLPQAVKLFRENATLYPNSLSARAELLQSLLASEDWNALAVEAENAYAAFPAINEFIRIKATALFELSEYASYIKEMERLIVSDPSDTAMVISAYSGIGDVYHLTGETSKAYKAYDKALKIQPRYAPILNNYAYYLSMEGKKLRKAYEMSKITVEDEPDNATYIDTFAWILHLQGKDLEAKPLFKHAMLYGGKDSAVIMDHYAEVLYSLQEYDLAKVYWNLAKAKNTSGEIPDLDERIKERIDKISK